MTEWNAVEISTSTLIGRSRECEISIATSSSTRTISSRHLRVFPTPLALFGSPIQWRIEDLNAKNGTSLNGSKILPRMATAIRDGDEILLASNTSHAVRIRVKSAQDSTSIGLEINAPLNRGIDDVSPSLASTLIENPHRTSASSHLRTQMRSNSRVDDDIIRSNLNSSSRSSSSSSSCSSTSFRENTVITDSGRKRKRQAERGPKKKSA